MPRRSDYTHRFTPSGKGNRMTRIVTLHAKVCTVLQWCLPFGCFHIVMDTVLVHPGRKQAGSLWTWTNLDQSVFRVVPCGSGLDLGSSKTGSSPIIQPGESATPFARPLFSDTAENE